MVTSNSPLSVSGGGSTPRQGLNEAGHADLRMSGIPQRQTIQGIQPAAGGLQPAPSVKLELGTCTAPEIDATLSEAHASYRSGDFHRALQLCQTVSPGPAADSLLVELCHVKGATAGTH